MNRSSYCLRCALVGTISLTAFSIANRLAKAQVPVCFLSSGGQGHENCLGCQTQVCPFCTDVGAGGRGTPTCAPNTKNVCEAWYTWRSTVHGGCEVEPEQVPCFYTYTCYPPVTCAGNMCYPSTQGQASETTFPDFRCIGHSHCPP
jgi:hypothetical protein